MTLRIRDVQAHDFDSILALNNAAGPSILPINGTGLDQLFDQARYFRLAEVDGHVAGFLPAMREDSSYDSPNFLWFRDRYPALCYIDRIVIAKPYRGLGLGRVFYADVTSYAETRVPMLACEVFLEPRDDVALLFHGTYGFQEVGQQTMPGNGRRVSLLAKTLCSFSFIDETYLQTASRRLPDEPWLAERAHAFTQSGAGLRSARIS